MLFVSIGPAFCQTPNNTALMAEARPETCASADVFVEISEDADAQLIGTKAMMAASLPQENSFIWFAAEAGVVRRAAPPLPVGRWP